MSKANYIGRSLDKYSTTVYLHYEYRGFRYMISDEHNGYSESLSEQHKKEQNRIDEIIEKESYTKDYNYQYTTVSTDDSLNKLFREWES